MNSDDKLLEETWADINRRQLAQHKDDVKRPELNIPPADDGTRERELSEREAAAAKSARAHKISAAVAKLESDRGARYRGCRLANFHCDTGPQTLAVEKLRAYIERIEQHAADGTGVFLFGPCGTGKDHLAMAVAVAFIHRLAESVAWCSGAMLFEKLRDSFDGTKTEGEVFRPYQSAALLWLSDPLPVKGELTQYQAEAIYRLVDARYNAKRPTLVTANMEPGAADTALGPAIARRFRESSLAIHCNWTAFKTTPE